MLARPSALLRSSAVLRTVSSSASLPSASSTSTSSSSRSWSSLQQQFRFSSLSRFGGNSSRWNAAARSPQSQQPQLWSRGFASRKDSYEASMQAQAQGQKKPGKRRKVKKVIKRKVRVGGVDLATAINNLKLLSCTNFVETVDISIHLGVDPRKPDEMVRGTCGLPHGTGKKQVVAVFARPGPVADSAKLAGADYVGLDDLVEKIRSGEVPLSSLTKCLATPDAMGSVGKIGRLLGPRGLMPNAKLGTMTPQIAQAVTDAKQGMVSFKCEKEGIVHAAVGKLNWDTATLVENAGAFIEAVKDSRPSGAKGLFVRGAVLSSTMGRGSQRLDIKLEPFRTNTAPGIFGDIKLVATGGAEDGMEAASHA